MYDYLIVGAGLFGSVFAHQVRKAGKSVLVIDQREHVGGNVYTRNTHGINVHVYGPHIFHTNDVSVWEFAQQFTTFNNFVNRPKALNQGKLYSLPVNLMTFYQIAGCTTPAEAQKYLDEHCVPCEHPKNAEEWLLAKVGPEIYEKLFRGYTKKQWRKDPKNLPAQIVARLPIRLTFDDNYYTHRYQGIPVGGYTPMMEKILDGIQVELGTTLQDLGDWRRFAKRMVYTGKIDELFDFCFGDLEYRSLEFQSEVRPGDYQGNAQINYPEEHIPWTRITEHKHFEFGTQEKTVITREYPTEWSREKVPYYPINDEKNQTVHTMYMRLFKDLPDVIGGGRLLSYRYFDMDQIIAQALLLASKELNTAHGDGIGAGKPPA